MKIGVFTFHRTCNYGVVLQAYATLCYLRGLGHDAEIVDYTNAFEQRIKRWSYREGDKVVGYATSLIKNLFLGKKRYSKRAFGGSVDLYELSTKRYTSHEGLEGLEYDCLVAGSDQIWNHIITGGIDEAFLLGFGTADKRISMASSMGSAELDAGQRERFAKLLEQFDAISVREKFAADALSEMSNKEIAILADPTLLLDREQWIDFADERSGIEAPKGSYILTYLIAPDKYRYRETVEEYRHMLGLPVWNVQLSNYRWRCVDRRILGATPADFVRLIDRAALVITDSFHGTAFSVNLQSDFVALRNSGNPVRVINLLDTVGLSERLEMPAAGYEPVDYGKATAKLEDMRRESDAWLRSALG